MVGKHRIRHYLDFMSLHFQLVWTRLQGLEVNPSSLGTLTLIIQFSSQPGFPLQKEEGSASFCKDEWGTPTEREGLGTKQRPGQTLRSRPTSRTATITMLFFLLAQSGFTDYRGIHRQWPLSPSQPMVPAHLCQAHFYYKVSSSLCRNIHVNICCLSGQVWLLVMSS